MVEEKYADFANQLAVDVDTDCIFCRMAECTPLVNHINRTRLFSNAGSGSVIRDHLVSWRIARGKAQPLHQKRFIFSQKFT